MNDFSIKELKVMYGHQIIDLVRSKVSKWDDLRKTGLCPFHNEKTPSFKYNASTYSFKCFGCGRGLDVFDYFEEFENMTKKEAVDEVKKAVGASTEYTKKMPSENVRSSEDTKFNFPNWESKDQSVKLIDYFDSRAISENTISHFEVTSKNGRMFFNIKDENGVLCNIKGRQIGDFENSKDKKYSQTKSAKNALFGMNKIKKFDEIIICEGEIDAMSIYEAGYQNIVSVPSGSANLTWINQNFDWLEKFKKIIIWSDQDDPGRKMRAEVCQRLGEDRTEYIEYDAPKNLKDANGVLVQKGMQEVLNIIKKYRKKNKIHGSISWDEMELLDQSDLSSNIPTGIYGLDRKLLDPRKGQTIVLTGESGTGKTTLMSQIKLSALNLGKCVFEYSGEMPAHRIKEWMYVQASQSEQYLTQVPLKYGRYAQKTDNVMRLCIDERIRDNYFLYDNKILNGDEKITETVIKHIKRYGCEVIVIDNLMTADYRRYSTSQNKNDQETAFVSELMRIAITYKVLIYLVAHPRKTVAGATKKTYSNNDVSGSGNIVNLVNTLIYLHKDEDDEQGGTIARIGKNRDFQETGEAKLTFEPATMTYRCAYKPNFDDFEWVKKYNQIKQAATEKVRLIKNS